MIIQIYPIISAEEALAAITAGVNYLGIVPPQIIPGMGKIPGELSEEGVFDILRATEGKATRVLIVISNDPEYCYQTAIKYKPDVLHLSGGEFFSTEEFSGRLKAAVPGILIEQAIPVASEAAVELAVKHSTHADLMILDSVIQGRSGIGAVGKTHDWSIDQRIVESVNIPVIIAGGLSPENVAEAIIATRPAGVDSCTRTNKTLPDGTECKDIDRVRRFCEIAKAFSR